MAVVPQISMELAFVPFKSFSRQRPFYLKASEHHPSNRKQMCLQGAADVSSAEPFICRQDAGSTLRDSWVVSMILMPRISTTNPPLPLPGGELTQSRTKSGTTRRKRRFRDSRRANFFAE